MVVWLRKCIHNVVVAVGFDVVVLCFYEVVLFYPDNMGLWKLFSSSDFRSNNHTLVVCVVGEQAQVNVGLWKLFSMGYLRWIKTQSGCMCPHSFCLCCGGKTPYKNCSDKCVPVVFWGQLTHTVVVCVHKVVVCVVGGGPWWTWGSENWFPVVFWGPITHAVVVCAYRVVVCVVGGGPWWTWGSETFFQ